MELIHACCAGLDVHKKTVVACVRRVGPEGQVCRHIRTFGTMTADLSALADWLAGEGVRHVALESTGVYWKPVFHLLEDRFEVLLANARQYRRPPGHKTDVKDAEWIADLHQHGLLKPSFIPPPPIRELRDLTRQRTQLVREKATVANRVQKVLEDANIKLSSVASDPLGVSGRAMLRAIIAGQDDPTALAELARKRLRGKIPALKQALCGRVTDHHRFLLRALLNQIEALEGWVAEYDEQIEKVLDPFAEAVRRLRTIPGVGQQAATVIVAEIGTEMKQFPSANHLTSWAGLCPGNNRSAGKQRQGKTTKGSQWLRTLLVQSAWAASHTKKTVFSTTYHRWVKRLGKKKSLVAVARKILVVVYHLLRDQQDYRERQAAPQAA